MPDDKFEEYWKERCAKIQPFSAVNMKTVAEEAWQASRAALRVELPPDLHAGDLFEDTPVYNASMIKVILQQAGIEVKHGAL